MGNRSWGRDLGRGVGDVAPDGDDQLQEPKVMYCGQARAGHCQRWILLDGWSAGTAEDARTGQSPTQVRPPEGNRP